MSMHDVNDADTSDEENTGRSKTFMASVVVVGAIVAAGLVLSVANVLDREPSPTAAPTATASPSVSSSSRALESVCGLTASKESGTLSLAPVTEWALVGTMAAPSIKGQGPGKTDVDGFRSCYARTPEGALLASANYLAVVSSKATTEKAVRGLVAEGVGRDYALANLASAPATPAELRAQVAGFRVVNFDGSLASVDVALRIASSGYASQVIDLTWQQGDWKVRFSDDGNFLSPANGLPSLTGYIPWSGA